MEFKINYFIIILVLQIFSIACTKHPPDSLFLKIKINDTIYEENITGKLILLFNSDTTDQLIYGVNPISPGSVFTYDIEDWNPRDTIVITQFKDEWYKKFSELNGEYVCRAILDKNSEDRSSFVAKDNGYSKRQKQIINKNAAKNILFEIENKFDGWVFSESETIKEVIVRSNLLSEFWRKDIYIRSAVIVPENLNCESNHYKIVYVFPGFGSNYASVTYGTGQIDRYGINKTGDPKIFVFMDCEFFQGYHHFADSDNNGPWGRAFIEEFIPNVENISGVNQNNVSRFLMGQSSGAWAALWLQVSFPEYFKHTFAASPDPIDFRAHGNNIYQKPSNYYYPANVDSAAINRGDKVKLYAKLEDVLGEFGQIRTWEATFSGKTPDGGIALLFDRESGNINPDVAEQWSRYDISKLIRDNPNKYKQTVSGKLHIFVSMDDPYGLNKSIELIEDVVKKTKIKVDIKYFNGLGHNVWTDELRKYIHEIIDISE